MYTRLRIKKMQKTNAFACCFASTIVTIKQHRLLQHVAVVRVRDSLQTYVSNWEDVKNLSCGSSVLVYSQGSLIGGNLQSIAANHVAPDGRVCVKKFGKLISFGFVVPFFGAKTAANAAARAVGQNPDLLLLTRYPAVMRHLLHRTGVIFEWNANAVFIGQLTVDKDCGTVDASSLQALEFARAHSSAIDQLTACELRPCFKSCTLDVHINDTDGAMCCTAITFCACDDAVGHCLTHKTLAQLCAKYRLPCARTVKAFDNDLLRWLNVNVGNICATFDRNTTAERNLRDIQQGADYYCDENKALYMFLSMASKDPEPQLLTDTQVLQIIRSLQTECDRYCAGKPCNGWCLQFDQLPDMCFYLPSLNFWLQDSNAASHGNSETALNDF